MTAHKDAALMLQYAQDAAETDKPWERWEWKRYESVHWNALLTNPVWSGAYDLRRKPDLETVRAAFRAAGIADGGVESFDDVGPELLWQIAEIRAQQERKPCPAWNDAPNVPGLWVGKNRETVGLFSYTSGYFAKGMRWYGPIPEDGKP